MISTLGLHNGPRPTRPLSSAMFLKVGTSGRGHHCPSEQIGSVLINPNEQVFWNTSHLSALKVGKNLKSLPQLFGGIILEENWTWRTYRSKRKKKFMGFGDFGTEKEEEIKKFMGFGDILGLRNKQWGFFLPFLEGTERTRKKSNSWRTKQCLVWLSQEVRLAVHLDILFSYHMLVRDICKRLRRSEIKRFHRP